MLKKNKIKSVISIILAVCMMSALIPSVFAAQSNEYVDPADSWLSSNNRTNELDVNATTTYETNYCCVCDKTTTLLTYRVPEYTKSGETALNRDVQYSDGTCIDGYSMGNLDDGTPGIDSYYTGYHWTKSVCQTCGTINSVDGPDTYNFNNNVYCLNPCDHNFFLDFDATTYELYDAEYHLSTIKKGEYCKFCKGTFARASEGLEEHNFIESVDAQSGNNRFLLSASCEDCDYETSEYVTAKAVVASYYGVEDGEAHTLTVTDLSDDDVKTSIRYGTSADECTKTSAPNYTKTGYYTVYYKISYSYEGETMTENGVSYICIVADDSEDENSDDEESNTIIVIPPATHEHEYHYIETVASSCDNLGYDRFQCSGCGALEKRNYTPAAGHEYDDVTIREETCTQGGLVLTLCSNCGDFYQTTTSLGEHNYITEKHNATCRNVGYTDNICKECGYSYITDITPLISHSYERVTKEPTCIDKGYTTSTCTMCGFNYVSDYTEPTGHDWDEGHTVTGSTCEAEGVIEYHCYNCDKKEIHATNANGHTEGAEATCTQPQLCVDCGTVLETARGHNYDTEVIEPTCTQMGYTIYTCVSCSDTYNSDYTEQIEHDYDKKITEPTCVSHGYTTYHCTDCDAEYVSDYTEKLAHDYITEVTQPTCTAMGFSTYTCKVCGDSYVGDYTDMTKHNYNKVITEPTCTEHGYAVYTCPDCGKSYISDYTDCIEHHYTETVIEPTCTQMGYTIFKCNDCDDEYKGNYSDKIPHDYIGEVIASTCTELGYTTYNCKNCDDSYISDYTDKAEHSYTANITEATCLTLGFTTYICENCRESYKADYKELLGHTPSEWITDIPATIESAGSKHIECVTCGEILLCAELPQLIDKDNSDEDGNAEIGDYSIILTDENGKPIFNSEITIDVNDNVSITLTAGRLLDFAKPTTITSFYTESQLPKENLNIFIVDSNGNKATGTTNADGQLIVPNNESNTGDDNGTIGKEDEKNKETFVVTVTDKANVVIPNCDIYIGESNNIVVDLPDGIKPTSESPVIITITDHEGNAQADVTVIALGDSDFIEKGKTDIYGKLSLPTASDGYTDENGKVNINALNVIVNDELGVISNAYVQHNEDGTITVTLPEGKTISYTNRITVTVLDSVGNAVGGKVLTVRDTKEEAYTDMTDKNGKVVVPPTNIDYTDANGCAEVNNFMVTVKNEYGFIKNAFINVDKNNAISVTLPEGIGFDYSNRIYVTVFNKFDNIPANNVTVMLGELIGVTDNNGVVVFPPLSEDITDNEGNSDVTDKDEQDETDTDGDGVVDVPSETVETKYVVTVKDTKAVITDALVSVKDGKIYVTLPGTHELDTSNRITVTVLDEDRNAVSDISVTVTDKNDKTATKKTNKQGQIIVPTKASSGGGSSSGGSSGGGGGSSSSYSTVNVKVVDKDGKSITVTKKTGTDKTTITLPTGKTLEDSYYTITVTDGNGKEKADYIVVLKDKDGNEVAGATDSNGIVILPTEIHFAYIVGYPDGTFRADGDMSRAEATAIFARLISEEKNEKISGKSTFADVSNNEWYADYIGYLEKYDIINGYVDNTFKPDNSVTRAEFVTMAVRFYALLNDVKKGDYVANYTDIDTKYWAYNDIAFAKNIGWLNGYADGTFKGDNNITRAEVVTVVNRSTGRTADENYIKKNVSTLNKFTDLKNNSHWAYYEIMEAANEHMAVIGIEEEVWVK